MLLIDARGKTPLLFVSVHKVSKVAHPQHHFVHTFLPEARTSVVTIDDVDEVLRSAIASKLDLLEGRFEQAIGHFESKRAGDLFKLDQRPVISF